MWSRFLSKRPVLYSGTSLVLFTYVSSFRVSLYRADQSVFGRGSTVYNSVQIYILRRIYRN